MRRAVLITAAMLAAAGALAGCASAPPRQFTAITDPTRRMQFQGFSVLPPQGTGWGVVGKHPLAAKIVKDLGGDSHATAAVSTERAGAPVHGVEGLAQHLQQRARDEAAAVDGGPPPEIAWTPRSAAGPPCIDYRFRLPLGGTGSGEGAGREVRVAGVACVHPDSDVVVISRAVGQALPVGAPGVDLAAETGLFLSSLEFEPLRKPFISAVVDAGKGLNSLAAGHGAIWAADTMGGAIVRVDPASGLAVARIAGFRGPVGIAITEDAVWCTVQHENSVVRIDPLSNKPTLRVKVGKGPLGIAYGDGALWVANSAAGTVSRVDPGSGRATAEIPVGKEATGVVFAGGQVWVSTFDDGRIVRIDPGSNLVVGEGIQTGCRPLLPASDGAVVWFPLSACEGPDALLKVDASGRTPPQRFPAGLEGPVSVKVFGTDILVTSVREGALQRLDGMTGALVGRGMAVAPGAFDVVIAAGSAWVSSKSTGHIYRIELE